MSGPKSPPASAPNPAPKTFSLVVRRTIRATPARLFAAWTQPEQLLAWWGPAAVTCIAAEIDLRVGGRYRLGNQFPDGNIIWIFGEFERVESPQLLIYTWRLREEAPVSERVTVRFEARDAGSTEIVIIHERLLDQASQAEHERGWFGCLDGLAEFLAARSQ